MKKEKDRPIEFDMEVVIRAMKDYCNKNGYDVDLIDRFDHLWDIVAALKSKGVKPDGLCNDMETMPYCVLYYDANGVIHETEHTERIRKKDTPGESIHGSSQDSPSA